MIPMMILKHNLEIAKVNESLLSFFHIKNPSNLVRRKVKYLNIEALTDLLTRFVDGGDDMLKSYITYKKNGAEVTLYVEMVKIYKTKKQLDFIILLIKDIISDENEVQSSDNKIEELSILHEINQLNHIDIPNTKILDKIVEKLLEITSFDYGCYFLYRKGESLLYPLDEKDISASNEDIALKNINIGMPLLNLIKSDIDDDKGLSRLFSEHTQFVKTDEKIDLPFFKSVLSVGIMQSVSIPMHITKQNVGVIVLFSTGDLVPKFCENSELGDLVSGHISSLLERADLINHLEKTISQVKVHNKSIDKQLQLAQNIQSGILAINFSRRPDVEFAVKYIPSHLLSGDFYDIFEIDEEKVGIIIADICGHGITSAMINSFLKGSIKELSSNIGVDSGNLLSRLNKKLIEILPQELFVSAFFAIIDFKSMRLYFSNAGHPAPIYYDSKSDSASEISVPGQLLSVLPNTDYPTREHKFNYGDKLLFFTDGIFNKDTDDPNIVKQQLINIIENKELSTAYKIVEMISDTMGSETDKVNDDINLIAVKFNNPDYSN